MMSATIPRTREPGPDGERGRQVAHEPEVDPVGGVPGVDQRAAFVAAV